MGTTIVQDKLLFDVLSAVSEPMTSLLNFKRRVLEIFSENLNVSSLKFSEYSKKNCGTERYVMVNPTTLNMPETFWGDSWMNYYYNSFIYNPNHRCVSERLKSRKEEYCIVSISDFMSFDEYENSLNYREVIKPSNYYYSFFIYFRDGDRLIGSLTAARPKSEGDFTLEEISSIAAVCPYINNRLIEYNRAYYYSSFRKLASDVLSASPVGLLLLDDKMNLLANNASAGEACTSLFGIADSTVKAVADLVEHHAKFNESAFTVTAQDGKPYYFSVNPYYSQDGGGDTLAYLISVSKEANKNYTTASKDESKLDSELTERQQEIIKLVAEGKTNREIAQELFISENTVRKHVENIRAKLGAKNRIEMLREVSLLAV